MLTFSREDATLDMEEAILGLQEAIPDRRHHRRPTILHLRHHRRLIRDRETAD